MPEPAMPEPVAEPGDSRGTPLFGGRVAAVVGATLLVCAAAGRADGQATAPPAPPPGLATAAWRLEAVTLRDGRRLEGLVVEGLVVDEPGAAAAEPGLAAPVGFVQVVRPPGRPMYLVTWSPISPARIATIERLPPAERALLARRVAEFRDRRGAEHAALTAVKLSRIDEDEPWRYAGRWFALESTADPQLTREAVVRLEQVFAALESLVPGAAAAGGAEGDAAAAGGAALTVRLCGSAAEYRGVQERLGVRADPPAFYVPARRLLVAGSDMPAIIEQERAAADELAAAERRLAERDRGFERNVRALAADLDRQGLPAATRAEAVQAARHRWQREREELLGRIVAARRDNAAAVEAARRGFFARLAHEAWHAYADLRLARPGGGTLPHWLDEGLAQVIETAPLEAGELRLDAPDPLRLKALQELLAAPRPPRVVDALAAGQEQFLSGHGGRRETSRHAYLMAWGLAFHLALLEPVLSRDSLASLTEPAGADAEPGRRVERFERLVGTSVAEFEAAWRARLMAARPSAPLSGPTAAP